MAVWTRRGFCDFESETDCKQSKRTRPVLQFTQYTHDIWDIMRGMKYGKVSKGVSHFPGARLALRVLSRTELTQPRRRRRGECRLKNEFMFIIYVCIQLLYWFSRGPIGYNLWWICNDRRSILNRNLKNSPCGSHSPQNAKSGHLALLFCRGFSPCARERVSFRREKYVGCFFKWRKQAPQLCCPQRVK